MFFTLIYINTAGWLGVQHQVTYCVCEKYYSMVYIYYNLIVSFELEAIKTLISSLVLSRLDYCNALFAGSPQVLHNKNSKSDQLLSLPHLQTPKSAHITP